MNDDLCGKIMTKFVWLRAKTYSYLIDDGSEIKKAKDAKKCVTKRKLKFEKKTNCLQILDHPYRILIIGGSGSEKTNSLSNLTNQQPDIDIIYLCAKDPYKTKYQFLINKQKSTDIKHFNDSKAFIEYSNDMHDIYKNIKEYNIRKT